MSITPDEEKAAAEAKAIELAEAKTAAEAKAEAEKKAAAEKKPKEKDPTPAELKAKNDEQATHIKTLNKENQQRREKLEAFEAAETKREEDELSEIDLLKKRSEESNAEINKLKLTAHQATAATEAGLPASFASRITGDTIEEMNADAKSLFDMLPVKPKPDPGITNPSNQNVSLSQETDDERGQRLGTRR